MKHNYLYLVAIALLLGLNACVDQDFDEPPSNTGISDLVANTTIAELKERHQSGVRVEITEDLIIEGRVISDDTEGNFFKNLIIQDETGGIEIRINQNQLQAVYQRDRTVFVKCQGLSIGDFNNFIQLGLGDDGSGGLGRIPETLVGEYIENGPFPDQPVAPKTLLISQIGPEDYGTLIQLADVEFSRDDFEKPYANPGGTSGTNRTIEDCLGGEITIRTSDFCDFAGDITPFGNGTIVGVASVFGSTKQILIRDVNDVDMPNTPCNRSSQPATRIDIADVRALFNNGTLTAPDALFIEGVIISDRSKENVVNQNLVIQDASGGIIVRFQDEHSIPLNENVRVDISGMELSEYQGWLQINGVPNERAIRLGAGTSPTPAVVTIDQILADFDSYESTLVKIENAEIQGSGTFSGANDVTDGTGTITMFTRGAASFSGEFIPSGMVTITAIVSQGGNDEVMQISIRDRTDVVGGSTGNDDPVDALFEDFEGAPSFTSVQVRNWNNIIVKGGTDWFMNEFDDNNSAQARGFQSGESDMETWLITPKLNLDVITTLEFESATAFWTHNGMTVLISTDYDGGSDVSQANWTELSPTLAGESSANYEWVPSGAVDISSFNGIGHVAFKYVGNENSLTGTYRVDNVDIK